MHPKRRDYNQASVVTLPPVNCIISRCYLQSESTHIYSQLLMLGRTSVQVVSLLGEYPWTPVMNGLAESLVQRGAVHATPAQSMTRATDPAILLVNYPPALSAYFQNHRSRLTIPYIWDVWTDTSAAFVKALRLGRPPLVFTASRWAEAVLAEELPESQVRYVPEGVPVRLYTSEIPLAQRTIGLFEYGRQNVAWHDAVTPVLLRQGIPHIYPAHRREVLQPAAFYRTMHTARAVACFSPATTHPGTRSSSMTARYLEATASGAIPVGDPIPDLTHLFGFDPVIPLDETDPAQVVIQLWKYPERFEQHSIRCRNAAMQLADWSHRVDVILSSITDITGARLES